MPNIIYVLAMPALITMLLLAYLINWYRNWRGLNDVLISDDEFNTDALSIIDMADPNDPSTWLNGITDSARHGNTTRLSYSMRQHGWIRRRGQ